MKPIFGLLQLFVLYKANFSPSFFVSKIVDDSLFAGTPAAIHAFHGAFGKLYTVGNFFCNKNLVFSHFHIHQDHDGTVHANMREYLDKIEALSLSQDLRKQD